MEDGQTDNSADEFEIVQMFRINTGMGVYLQGIIIVCGIFEKTVERIEHFVGKKEEKLSVQELAVTF